MNNENNFIHYILKECVLMLYQTVPNLKKKSNTRIIRLSSTVITCDKNLPVNFK